MSNNSSNSPDENEEVVKPVLIVVSVFSFIGIPGNLLSIALILRAKHKKSTTTFLLLNLATADIVNLLGVLLTATTLLVLNNSKSMYIHAAFAITFVPHHVANFTLALIAIERYNGLVNAMNPFSVLSSKQKVKGILVVFWLVALVLRVPVPTAEIAEKIGSIYTKIYYHVTFICTYTLPLFIVTICYTKILKGVFYDRNILGKNVTSRAELMEKKRVVRVMLVVTAIFMLSNLPAFVSKIIHLAHQKSPSKLKAALVILGCLPSSVNPYIYGLQSEKYRKQVKELFRFSRADGSQHQETQL